jgi:hypothetical protein
MGVEAVGLLLTPWKTSNCKKKKKPQTQPRNRTGFNGDRQKNLGMDPTRKKEKRTTTKDLV